MATECYWCIDGGNELSITKGPLNVPVGCCLNCHALICGHHGQRDDVENEFMCYRCDTSLLVASGGAQTSTSKIEDDPYNPILKLIRHFGNSNIPLFKSLTDFQLRRPSHLGYFDQINESEVDFNAWPDIETKDIVENLNEEGKRLMTAAAVMMKSFYSRNEIVNKLPPFYLYLTSRILIFKRRGL